MSFALQITSAAETEAVTSQKLVKGHAYSVTGAEEVGATPRCSRVCVGQPQTHLLQHCKFLSVTHFAGLGFESLLSEGMLD